MEDRNKNTSKLIRKKQSIHWILPDTKTENYVAKIKLNVITKDQRCELKSVIGILVGCFNQIEGCLVLRGLSQFLGGHIRSPAFGAHLFRTAL